MTPQTIETDGPTPKIDPVFTQTRHGRRYYARAMRTASRKKMRAAERAAYTKPWKREPALSERQRRLVRRFVLTRGT